MPQPQVLDAKDRAILYHLDQDARQSNSLIAKKTRLSKEVVNYRIKNLISRGVLQGYYTIINASKLGFMIFRIFFRFQNVGMEKEKEILDYLQGLKSVGWVVMLEEMYDLAILVWARNVFDFKETHDEILAKYGPFFQDSFVTIVTHIYHFVNNHLFQTKDLGERVIGGRFERVGIDKMDLQILALLGSNARVPLLNVSKELQVAPNTVKQRIRRMKEKGIIVGFKAKLNTGALGYQHYKIFLQLVDVSPAMKLRLREYLKQNLHVIYVTEAIGRADLEFEIQVRNGPELRAHVREIRKYLGTAMKNYSTTLVNREYVVDYFPRRCSILDGK